VDRRYSAQGRSEDANKAEAVAEVQEVFALDQVLAQQTFIELRAKLAAEKTADSDYNTRVDLRRYVAAFERLGMLVDKKVVSPELADESMGRVCRSSSTIPTS
jgi:hypothetical protein